MKRRAITDCLSTSLTMTTGRSCTSRVPDRRHNAPYVLLFLVVCYLPIATSQETYNPVMAQNTCVFDAHCLNGGQCMPGDEVTPFKHCRCPSGFSGPRCAHYCPYDCQNGGYCTVTPIGESVGLTEQTKTAPKDTGAYMCKCKGRFAGPFCDIPYANCGHTGRCFNGGVCEKQDDENRKCSCPQGYGGENCEIEVEKVEFGDTISFTSMNGLTRLLIAAVALFGATVLALVAVCLTGKQGLYRFDHVHYDYDEEEEFSLPEVVETGRRYRGIQLNVV